MDNPIAPMDRSGLFPGSNRVKPLQESDKEKDRKKFSEELEEELDEEQKRKKRDTVEIGSVDHPTSDAPNGHEKPADDPGGSDKEPQRHVDLTA